MRQIVELKLIVAREYLSRIKKKSFVFLTCFIPILWMILVSFSLFLFQENSPKTIYIAVLDNTYEYGHFIKSNDRYKFNVVDDTSADLIEEQGYELFGILQINDDLSKTPTAAVFISEFEMPQDLSDYLSLQLSEVANLKRLDNWAADNAVDGYQLSVLKNAVKVNISSAVSAVAFDNRSSVGLASSIGAGLTIMMYFFILMYGTMVLNGVVEEKSNRIAEVLFCTVSPFKLLMGKIIGIGLAGLTQVFIWFILVFIFYVYDGSLSLYSDLIFSINWIDILIWFFILFVGGYLVYAALFSMFGAAMDNVQDTQQFVVPVTFLFIFSFYIALFCLNDPHGSMAFWFSIIPFTSPVVMIMRIPFGVPMWEKIVSVILLYAMIVFLVKISTKVYRANMLMYGKKASIKDLFMSIFIRK